MKQYGMADEIYAEDHSGAYVVIRDQDWRNSWFINKTYLATLGSEATDSRQDEDLKCPLQTNPSYRGFSLCPQLV